MRGDSRTLFEAYEPTAYLLDTDYGINDVGEKLLHSFAEDLMALLIGVVRGAIVLTWWLFSLTDIASLRDAAVQTMSLVGNNVFQVLFPAALAAGGVVAYANHSRARGAGIGQIAWVFLAGVLSVGLILSPSIFVEGADNARRYGAAVVMESTADAVGTGSQQPFEHPHPGFTGSGQDTLLRKSADAIWRGFAVTPWCVAEFGSIQACKRYGSEMLKKGSNRDQRVDYMKGVIYKREGGKDSAGSRWLQGHNVAERISVVALALLAAVAFGFLIASLAVAAFMAVVGSYMLLIVGVFFALCWVIPGRPRQWGINWFEALVGLVLQSVVATLTLGVVLVMTTAVINLTDQYGWLAVAGLSTVVVASAWRLRRTLETIFSIMRPGHGSALLGALALHRLSRLIRGRSTGAGSNGLPGIPHPGSGAPGGSSSGPAAPSRGPRFRQFPPAGPAQGGLPGEGPSPRGPLSGSIGRALPMPAAAAAEGPGAGRLAALHPLRENGPAAIPPRHVRALGPAAQLDTDRDQGRPMSAAVGPSRAAASSTSGVATITTLPARSDDRDGAASPARPRPRAVPAVTANPSTVQAHGAEAPNERGNTMFAAAATPHRWRTAGTGKSTHRPAATGSATGVRALGASRRSGRTGQQVRPGVRRGRGLGPSAASHRGARGRTGALPRTTPVRAAATTWQATHGTPSAAGAPLIAAAAPAAPTRTWRSTTHGSRASRPAAAGRLAAQTLPTASAVSTSIPRRSPTGTTAAAWRISSANAAPGARAVHGALVAAPARASRPATTAAAPRQWAATGRPFQAAVTATPRRWATSGRATGQPRPARGASRSASPVAARATPASSRRSAPRSLPRRTPTRAPMATSWRSTPAAANTSTPLASRPAVVVAARPRQRWHSATPALPARPGPARGVGHASAAAQRGAEPARSRPYRPELRDGPPPTRPKDGRPAAGRQDRPAPPSRPKFRTVRPPTDARVLDREQRRSRGVSR